MHEQQPGSHRQQPAQPGGAPGAIAITLVYHPVNPLAAMVKPRIYLNGMEAARGWGRQVMPVLPGAHNVHVQIPKHVRHIGTSAWYGKAAQHLEVHPGRTVELEYRAPLVTSIDGNLGFPPQPHRGMGALVGLLIVGAVGIAAALALPLLLGPWVG